jgi:hypothetical protein
MREQYMRQGDGFMLVFSVDKATSFELLSMIGMQGRCRDVLTFGYIGMFAYFGKATKLNASLKICLSESIPYY